MKKGTLVGAVAFLLALTMVIVFGVPYMRDGRPRYVRPVKTSATVTTTVTTTEPTTAEPKLIAFSFDDGPKNSTTNQILDLLEQYGCTASFFVVGQNVAGCEDTVRRAVALGCEIGNHSYSHINLATADKATALNELALTNEIIYNLTGQERILCRAPYGSFSGIRSLFNAPLIQWNIDTLDWQYKDDANPDRSAEQREKDLQTVVSTIVDNVTDGDIILMHDYYQFTVDAFAIALPILIERGYKIVSVSELFEAYGTELKTGYVYEDVYTFNAPPASTKAPETTLTTTAATESATSSTAKATTEKTTKKTTTTKKATTTKKKTTTTTKKTTTTTTTSVTFTLPFPLPF